jgi:hypothetical protein
MMYFNCFALDTSSMMMASLGFIPRRANTASGEGSDD